MFGDSAVGKTTLLKAYLENKFTANPVTIGPNFYTARPSIDGEKYRIEIWDTPDHGQFFSRFYASVSLYKKTDVFLLVFSVNDFQSCRNVVTKWIPEIESSFPTVPIILVGNKTDLREKDNKTVTTEMGKQLARDIKAEAYFECSCLDGRTTIIEEIFKAATRAALVGKMLNIIKKSNETLHKLHLVGDAKVGKTALCHAYLKNTFKDYDSDTVVKAYLAPTQLIDGKKYELNIIMDIGHSETGSSISKICHTMSNVIIFVFSVVDLHSFKSVQKKWIPEIKEHCPNTPVILVGNKTDLREKDNENATIEMGEQLASEINAVGYFECSCRDGRTAIIEEIFRAAARAAHGGNILNNIKQTNESLLTVHLVGDANVGKTAICHAYLKNTFKDYDSNMAVKVYVAPTQFIDGKKYELKIMDIRHSERVAYINKMCYTLSNVIIVVFSVVDLDSFQSVREKWIPEIKEHCPATPVILVGNKTDLRKSNEIVTTEMVKQLASEINAVAYFECFCHDGRRATIKQIFEEAVRATHLVKVQRFLQKSSKTLFKVHLVGDKNVGKTSLVKTFQHNERSNVFGERLDNRVNPDYSFSAFTEMDGEECGWIIWDGMKSKSDITKCDRVLLKKDRGIDVFMLMFSVVDFDSYTSIENKWIPEMKKMKHCNPKIPIVLMGNKTDLRKHSKRWITTEKGEQLARRINAAKYFECSSTDRKEVEKVFEETAWTTLRYAEEKRKPKSWFRRWFGI